MLTPTTRNTPNSQRLAEHAEAIRKLRRNVIAEIIDIGKHLIAAKSLAGHGNWLTWLKAEFAWSETTARNYMRVAQAGISTPVADLKLPVSSLYQITAPSTPPAVRNAVIKTARKREVTHEEVVETVRAARPVQRTETKPVPMSHQEVVELVGAAVEPPRPVARLEPAQAMNGAPADFVQLAQAVDGFVSVALHLVRREQVSVLKNKNLPPKLRDRLLECLKFLADQVNDLIAALEVPPKR